MTGPEGENSCEYGCPHSGCPHEMRLIARAQAHATLAFAMATALGEQETEYKDWLRVNAGGDLS